jgi:hypothetical protein
MNKKTTSKQQTTKNFLIMKARVFFLLVLAICMMFPVIYGNNIGVCSDKDTLLILVKGPTWHEGNSDFRTSNESHSILNLYFSANPDTTYDLIIFTNILKCNNGVLLTKKYPISVSIGYIARLQDYNIPETAIDKFIMGNNHDSTENKNLLIRRESKKFFYN